MVKFKIANCYQMCTQKLPFEDHRYHALRYIRPLYILTSLFNTYKRYYPHFKNKKTNSLENPGNFAKVIQPVWRLDFSMNPIIRLKGLLIKDVYTFSTVNLWEAPCHLQIVNHRTKLKISLEDSISHSNLKSKTEDDTNIFRSYRKQHAKFLKSLR